jgi:glycosyltransferase involved in cell wall biosynthesis
LKQIKLIADHIFPYTLDAFSTPRIRAERVHRKKSLTTALDYLRVAAYLFYRSFSTDVILGNRRVTLLLGLLFTLYKPRHVSLVGYEIIFNFKDTQRTKRVIALWKRAIKNVDLMVVQTPQEVDYYAEIFGVSPQKFKFIPFYVEATEFIGPTSDGYVFSAGRMERDFVTLLNALRGTDVPVVIVADSAQQSVLEQHATPNTQLHFNIPKEKYLALLRGARLVVISLKDGSSSRGQVVYLESIRYGKPVICSRVEGIADYVDHERTGWLVPPEDPEQLKRAIESCFSDSEALQEIGRNAYQEQQTRFSPAAFHQGYHQIIEKLYQKKLRH